MPTDAKIDVSELGGPVPATEHTLRYAAGPGQIQRVQLSVATGPDAGRTVETATSTFSIGSHPSNALVLTDPTVSRFHCELQLDERGAWLQDLNSTNGTELDGVALGRGGVKEGSWVRLGNTQLQLHYGAPVLLPLHEQDHFGDLVGASPVMRRAFALLQKAANSDSTVLIRGETGTGKEGAAEAVHGASRRAKGPFVVVDCSALPPNLLEAELFGHEQGAFTGAVRKRAGAFQEASGGTIFLDELGELPLDLQPKLLRVLEQHKIRAVGADHFRSVDIRVVAATHRDLRSLVNEGKFRADLYYRLAVLEVTLPPLRHRAQDIPLLVRHLAKAVQVDDSLRSLVLDDAFLERASNAAWPGNVRELRNYVERCLVLQQVAPIDPSDPSATPARPAAQSYRGMAFGEAKKTATEAFERQFLAELLNDHNGNLSQAARAADMDRPYLYKLLHRHGLRRT